MRPLQQKPFVRLCEQSGTCSYSWCRSWRSCMSLAQFPTLIHQQACLVVSLASTSLAWSDQTAPLLCPLKLLLLNCILFSCCSSSASTCQHTHAVPSIMSTNVTLTTVVLPPKLSTSITYSQTHIPFYNLNVLFYSVIISCLV